MITFPPSHTQTKKTLLLFFLLFFRVFLPFICSAKELTISEGLLLALKEENLIKAKEYEEAISFLESKVARSPLLPHVELSYGKVSLNHEPTSINFLRGMQVRVPVSERDFYTYSLTVRQLLFDFLGTYSFYNYKKLSHEIKKIELERVKNSVAFEFLRYFFDLKEQEKTIEVLEKEVERLSAHFADAKSLYEAGLITKNELLYTDVLLSDAKQRVINMKNIRKLTASILNKMMGRPTDEDIVLEEPKREPYVSQNLQDYVSQAYSNRQELKILKKAREQLTFLKQAKRSEFLPKFFLEAKYSFTENRYQLYEGITSVTLGMNMNLFEGGKTKTELKIIEMEEKKLDVEEKKIREDIRIEVEKYFLDFFNAKERLKVAQGAIKQAEENLRITKVKYKEGVGTGTEVLDAIVALCRSETNYYKAFYDLLRAEAGLLYALGRDLKKEYEK